MKAYLHLGEGIYTGSAIVVVAPNRVEAERMIRGILDSNGLPNEKLDISEFETDNPCVVYVDNGDC